MPFKLPELYADEGSRSVISLFQGINRAPVIAEGEFSEMVNMTSEGYPTLSAREPYGKVDLHTQNDTPICVTTTAPHGVDQVCFIDPPNVYIGGIEYDLGISAEDPDRPKQIVRMGAYLIVLPDMVYINTVDVTDKGKIEDTFSGSVDYEVTVVDFEGNSPDYSQVEKPSKTLGPVMVPQKDENGDFVYDESGNKVMIEATDEYGRIIYETLANGVLWHRTGSTTATALYRWDADAEKWEEEKSYLKVTNAGTLDPFSMKKELKTGDAVRISGTGIFDGLVQIENAEAAPGFGKGSVGSFRIPGIIGTTVEEVKSITVSRAIPVLDYACESGNRLWGCRYGENDAGEKVNEIYCSALGDFFRWYIGPADNDTSPVTFSVGTDGKFTGCMTYGGYPTFFKEGYMHRVGGYLPSDFSVYTEKAPGVRSGCHRSLAVVNNVLYYVSPSGVMGFDGSAPVKVSDKLGSLSMYANAVGGRCGEKYYLHLRQSADAAKGRLYVLDTALGMWHAEGEDKIESMAEYGDDMLMIRMKGDTHDILTVKPGTNPEGAVTWMCETGNIGMESPDRKYITRLTVKLSAELGSKVRVSILYDSVGTWKQIFATEMAGVRPVTVPILPMPCDHFKLRIEGKGPCRIYNITKTMREGAERL